MKNFVILGFCPSLVLYGIVSKSEKNGSGTSKIDSDGHHHHLNTLMHLISHIYKIFPLGRNAWLQYDGRFHGELVLSQKCALVNLDKNIF